ncbi:MAG: glycosyltransferase family 39 protein [Pyrinomonadaceae bacterium]
MKTKHATSQGATRTTKPVPTPTTKPVPTPAPARTGFMSREDWSIAALVVAVKSLLFLFGAGAYTVFKNESLGAYDWLAIWNRWDAPHYLDIAREGYVAAGEHSQWIVFYPLYPWLVRLCAFVFGDELVAAFFVSTIASVTAAVLLYRLVALDEEEGIARAAVFFLLIFPTSYFLHIGYTESLFLSLALGAFLSARTGRWLLAGILCALACMTRINGLLLIPALACEAFMEFKAGGRRWQREWLWIALAFAGFGVYLLINETVAGRPFAFLDVQKEHWAKTLTWPWVGIIECVSAAHWRSPAEAQTVVWQELFFILLGLGCTVWCWFTARASYALWMTCNWLLWTSTKFILSVPRYTLIMFPIYMLFARASAGRPFWRGAITVWSLLYLALFATLFVQGWWAF